MAVIVGIAREVTEEAREVVVMGVLVVEVCRLWLLEEARLLLECVLVVVVGPDVSSAMWQSGSGATVAFSCIKSIDPR